MSRFFNKKITRDIKRQKTQFEKKEQTSEPDSEMAVMLELPDHELKTTVINMLRALMNKVDNMQEQCNKQRDGNSKKELKRNAKDKNMNRNERCL